MRIYKKILYFLSSLLLICSCQNNSINYNYKFVPLKENFNETNQLLIDSIEEKEEIEYLSIEEYDIQYFIDKALVIVNLPGDSGSVEYIVDNIEVKDNILNIDIIKKYPKAVTLDLVCVSLVIEITLLEANEINDINVNLIKKYSLI